MTICGHIMTKLGVGPMAMGDWHIVTSWVKYCRLNSPKLRSDNVKTNFGLGLVFVHTDAVIYRNRKSFICGGKFFKFRGHILDKS